jgi:hypothetical protein
MIILQAEAEASEETNAETDTRKEAEKVHEDEVEVIVTPENPFWMDPPLFNAVINLL